MTNSISESDGMGVDGAPFNSNIFEEEKGVQSLSQSGKIQHLEKKIASLQ